MRPNTYNPDCDFDPDQRDLDASIKERNKTESDATERARALEDAIEQLTQDANFAEAIGQASDRAFAADLRTVINAARSREQYATKQIQIQTPRIKADAVREFVGKLTNKIDRSFVSGIPRKAFAKGTEVYQGYNNGLSTVLYILEKEFPEIAKEMTEVD